MSSDLRFFSLMFFLPFFSLLLRCVDGVGAMDDADDDADEAGRRGVGEAACEADGVEPSKSEEEDSGDCTACRLAVREAGVWGSALACELMEEEEVEGGSDEGTCSTVVVALVEMDVDRRGEGEEEDEEVEEEVDGAEAEAMEGGGSGQDCSSLPLPAGLLMLPVTAATRRGMITVGTGSAGSRRPTGGGGGGPDV